MSDFLAESINAVRTAKTPADLNAVYATRNVALVFDSATMRDLRALAAAWVQRRHQLLDEAMDGDQP